MVRAPNQRIAPNPEPPRRDLDGGAQSRLEIEQAPSLGDTVLVKTPHTVDGQREHAAIITRIHPGDVVNVLLLPGSSEPYPVELVRAAKTGAPISWRFRS
jgi:hypothetical protein